ncbi:hypothetical protein HanIR_Chr06g0288471 [Helianthus annuus]|nr:hypothetical protein HanIR_Chr06g0288471 [Helianthus annuus]
MLVNWSSTLWTQNPTSELRKFLTYTLSAYYSFTVIRPVHEFINNIPIFTQTYMTIIAYYFLHYPEFRTRVYTPDTRGVLIHAF